MLLCAAALHVMTGLARAADGYLLDTGIYSTDSFSEVTDITPDGRVVSGWASNSTMEAFTWSEAGGYVALPSPGIGTWDLGIAISADGRTVVGLTQMPGNAYEAARWVDGVGTSLGDLGGNYSYAFDVNGDGSVVVGESYNGHNAMRAFVWTISNGLSDLGTLPGDIEASARGISRDGMTIVGASSDDPAVHSAVKWTSTNGWNS